jgi:hypothetical protein
MVMCWSTLQSQRYRYQLYTRVASYSEVARHVAKAQIFVDVGLAVFYDPIAIILQ